MPLTLQDLLAIEQTSDVLDFSFQFDGLLMWPFVRVPMMLAAFLDAYGLSNPHIYTPSRNPRDIISYMFHTISKNPFTTERGRKYEILIFGSAVNDVKRGAKYFNRLHDYLASEYVDVTLFIEDSIRIKYLRPRYFQNLKYHDLISILGIVESRIRPNDSRDAKRIQEFLSFLKARFPYRLSAPVWARVGHVLRTRARRIRALYRYYDKLFDRLQPKVVFLEDASYTQRCYILKWAKDRGIVTAELQHGLVTANHPAYNYGPGIRLSPRYGVYLPDYFLTHGPYWSAQISTMSEKVVAGNPNLTEYVKNYNSQGTPNENREVLVISTGINPDGLKPIVRELIRITGPKDFKVRLRPHPCEMPVVKKRYGELLQYGRDTIDLSSDLYESLRKADYVAGEVSTVLFEAAHFRKPVFAMDHPYTNLNIGGTFPRFKTGEELASLIMSCDGSSVPDPSLFWEADWRGNYRNFIRRVLGPRKTTESSSHQI